MGHTQFWVTDSIVKSLTKGVGDSTLDPNLVSIAQSPCCNKRLELRMREPSADNLDTQPKVQPLAPVEVPAPPVSKLTEIKSMTDSVKPLFKDQEELYNLAFGRGKLVRPQVD